MATIPGLTINEAEYELPNNIKGKIAVFIYIGKSDPEKILDNAVSIYVGNNGYHELIDAHLDNPWMRVVISDINSMKQEKYDSSRHRLNTKNVK
jgi:hypothetical protein